MDNARFPPGLVPELDRLAHRHVERCEGAHLHVAFGSDGGWRAPSTQTQLWKRGRELTPTGWQIVNPSAVVTYATPANAPHCRGAAYDLWLLFGHTSEDHHRLATMSPQDGWTPHEIELQTTLWGAVVRIGSELGLEAGAHWPRLKDFPHFQLKTWRAYPLKDSP